MKATILKSLAVGCLLLVFAAFGCKENSTKNGMTSDNSVTETKQVDTVYIKGMKFNPEKLTIHKGDKVVWVNKGIVEHDVTKADSAWTSGNIKVGETWERTPTGSFDYFCSIHPTMKGSIVVE